MNKYLSRKFLLAVVPILIVILNNKLQLRLTTIDISAIAAMVVGFIAGESYIDSKGVVQYVEYHMGTNSGLGEKAPVSNN